MRSRGTTRPTSRRPRPSRSGSSRRPNPRRSKACPVPTLSCACAALSCWVSAVVSIVARTCPAVTVCPAFTVTPLTTPDTAKLRLAWLAGSMVPELVTVCWIVPVVTGTVTVVIERPPAWRNQKSARGAVRSLPRPRRRRCRRWAIGNGPRTRWLGSKDVLVVEWQLLREVHWGFRRVGVSRFDHAASSDDRFHNEPTPSCESAWCFV